MTIVVPPIITVEVALPPPIEIALENATAEGLITQHEAAIDPHPQYAKDTDLISHANDQVLHLPNAGVSTAQIATEAAIEWSKISKAGATAADVGAQASNSRLSEIGSLFASAAAGSNLRKGSEGSALEFAVPRSRILYRWGGTETITGSLSEIGFVNGSYTIPANTLSAASTLDIFALFSNSSSAPAKTIKLKFGSTTVFSNVIGTPISFFIFKQLFCTAINAQLAASQPLFSTTTSTSAIQTLSIDFAQNQAFQVTGQLADVADNLTLKYIELREAR